MDNWKKSRKPSAKECAQFYLEGSNQQKKEVAAYVERKTIQSKRKRWKLLDRDIKKGFIQNIKKRALTQKNTKNSSSHTNEITDDQSSKELKIHSKIGRDINIEETDLSVRAINALRHEEISTIDELSKLSKYDLQMLPNVGRKTVKEILELIESARFNENSSGAHENAINKIQSAGIMSRINNLLPKSEPRRKAIKARLFEGATLEESGIMMNVSRERVRQIEANIIRKMGAFGIFDIASEKIQRILSKERLKPISLPMIEANDEWFTGITSTIEDGKSGIQFFRKIVSEEIRIENINEKIIFYLKGESSFREIKKIIAEKKTFEADFKEDIKIILFDEKRPELLDLSINHFLNSLNDRKASKFFVDSIVKENEDGLSLVEIERRIYDISGLRVPRNQVSNAVNESEQLFQWKDRKWKHEDHSKTLNREEIEKISSDVIEIMEKTPEKQWRIDNLHKKIRAKSEGYQELTQYDLNRILRKAKDKKNQLKYLGRDIWELEGNQQRRLELVELAIEIIKDFGRPMEASLLREKIMEHRDIKANQQIHAKGELVHIDYGLYGIRKRDIELTIEEEKELFALFYLRLLIYPEGSFDGENAKAHILQTVVDFEKGETNERAAMIILKSIELKEILQDLENHLPQSFIDYLSGKRKGKVPKYLHEPWKDPYTGEIKYLDVTTNDIQGKEVSFLEWLNNFSLDKEWVEKHIRSKRKWSSILRKKRTKIFSIQAKIKNIETKLDIDFKKILSFAEESLDEILKLDKAYTDSRWNIGTEENLLLPEKITYFQLIRLLRMSDRFNADISNEEYPKLSINKSSN